MKKYDVRIAAIAAAVASLGLTSGAQAQSFALRSQNAEGAGMAFAGAAAGSIGLGSLFFNPATITQFEGRRSQWNIIGTLPSASYSFSSAGTNPAFGLPLSTGNIGIRGAIAPASFNSWQLTDRLWIGLTTGSPFGLRSKPENQNFAGQTYGRSSTARSINVTPTAGYKINDWLSVGAGLQIQYFKADLKQALVAVPNAPSSQLTGDDWDFGFRLGATIKPFEGTTIGVGYRSSIRHDLSGRLRTGDTNAVLVGALAPFQNASPQFAAGSTPIEVNLNLPEALNLGISQKINEQWQVNFSFEWQNWSRFGRLPVTNKVTGAPITSLNFVYDDSFHFAFGAEYDVNPSWTVRAGVGYDISPVSDEVRGVRISDNDRLWFSAGTSFKATDRLSFDLGYSFLYVFDSTINVGPGHPDFNPAISAAARPILNPTLVGEASPNIHVLAFGVNYRWDDPAPKVAAEPLVRKY